MKKIFLLLSFILFLFTSFLYTHASYAVTSAGQWVSVPDMQVARIIHGVVVLNNGKVLVTGGGTLGGSSQYTAISQLYDPVTQTWSSTTSMNEVRGIWGNSIVKLNDGRVLVAGGETDNGVSMASSELYDPSTEMWTATGSLNTARQGAVMVLLHDGRPMIIGGNGVLGSPNQRLASAEIYDPFTGTWSNTIDMNKARALQGTGVIVLQDGRVLVVGGDTNGPDNTAEIYDPSTNAWTFTQPIPYVQFLETVTLLSDGRVLATGGSDNTQTLPYAALFDPATNAWTQVASMHIDRGDHNAALLSDGNVLVFGGNSTHNGGIQNTSEIYNPITDTWSMGPNFPMNVSLATTITLPNGDIFVTGGRSPSLSSNTEAVIFTSSIITPTLTPTLTLTPTMTATPTPLPYPTNKDQCKNGGWKTFTNPTFKNQGECVSWVNHH